MFPQQPNTCVFSRMYIDGLQNFDKIFRNGMGKFCTCVDTKQDTCMIYKQLLMTHRERHDHVIDVNRQSQKFQAYVEVQYTIVLQTPWNVLTLSIPPLPVASLPAGGGDDVTSGPPHPPPPPSKKPSPEDVACNVGSLFSCHECFLLL